MAYGLNGYRRTNIQTADPRRLVVLLYEGAVGYLNRAIVCMKESRRDGQAVLINKTLDILRFLANALDFSRGAEIAARLDSLYAYMRDALTMANVENDEERVSEVISLLNTLLEGWRGIVDPSQFDEEPASLLPAAPQDAPAGVFDSTAFPAPETDAAPEKWPTKVNGSAYPFAQNHAASTQRSTAIRV